MIKTKAENREFPFYFIFSLESYFHQSRWEEMGAENSVRCQAGLNATSALFGLVLSATWTGLFRAQYQRRGLEGK